MKIYLDKCKRLRDKYHSSCLFNNIDDLKIGVRFTEDGSLIGNFYCIESYQGYNQIMHGGVLSALIDSAMTQCLFGNGLVGYTVRLNIKYTKKVSISKNLNIKVRIKDKSESPIVELIADISQDGLKKVSAEAKFWIIKDESNL